MRADHGITVDIHAHQLRRNAILGERAHGATGFRELHEKNKGSDEDHGKCADQHAVIRHDQPVGYVYTIYDLRHATLFFTKQKQNNCIEKECHRRRKQHRTFIAQTSLDNRPE